MKNSLWDKNILAAVFPVIEIEAGRGIELVLETHY